jgi:hypothetical protein
VYYRLGFGEQFQNVQEAIVPVVGHIANPVSALNSRARHLCLDLRRIEKKILVYVQRSMRYSMYLSAPTLGARLAVNVES